MVRKSEFTSKVDIVIAHKIKELRLAKGWSRQQLAAKIGVTHQQLQKYEKGTNRISGGRLLAIANALNKTVSFFFENIEDFVPTPSKKERLCIELSREFLKINNESLQDSITMMVRNIARTTH